MRNIKRIVAFILLITSVLAFTGCAPKKNTSITDNADPEVVERMRNSMREAEAESKGDTYCKHCEKFIEGKVRICPYCGKYI